MLACEQMRAAADQSTKQVLALFATSGGPCCCPACQPTTIEADLGCLCGADDESGGGGGFFSCRYPNATLVAVRHVIDLVHVGGCMARDLDQPTRQSMRAFYESELRTADFVRALSLKDKVANIALR
jgi:hypothetical protein